MHAKGTILTTTISSTSECVTFVQLTWATFKCTTWYILLKTKGQKNDGVRYIYLLQTKIQYTYTSQ